eukprot:1681820-Pyramimonas_sp.AAC.1
MQWASPTPLRYLEQEDDCDARLWNTVRYPSRRQNNKKEEEEEEAKDEGGGWTEGGRRLAPRER